MSTLAPGSRRPERHAMAAAIGVLLVVSVTLPAIDALHLTSWGGPEYGESAGRLIGLGIMWVAMMTVMMLPSVAPWTVFVAKISADRGGVGPRVAVLTFLGGYGIVWSLFGLVAAATQVHLQAAAWLPAPELRLTSPLGGAVLIAAGLFQFSPLKRRCLLHCRSPVGFLLGRWRDETPNVMRLGLLHGAFCVGCCWALMALMFTVGVMSAVGMAGLAVLVAAEQVTPVGVPLSRLVGVVLIGVGIALV